MVLWATAVVLLPLPAADLTEAKPRLLLLLLLWTSIRLGTGSLVRHGCSLAEGRSLA